MIIFLNFYSSYSGHKFIESTSDVSTGQEDDSSDDNEPVGDTEPLINCVVVDNKLGPPLNGCNVSSSSKSSRKMILVVGGGLGVRVGQATVTTCSGSGDQQLSDNQHPITTVTRPIANASIM